MRIDVRKAAWCAIAAALSTLGWGAVYSQTEEPVRNWLGVQDFLYQLQNADVEEIAASGFDLVVVDISEVDTPEAVMTLRDSGKLVLCYMSIGEAEDYRWYWLPEWERQRPAFLDQENPDWPGNYKVRYWDPAWQALLFGSPNAYLDRILDLGYDGVYLDLVDAYTYYEEQGREAAAQEMVDFVLALAAYARVRDPEFGVFPQNAEELGAAYPDYLSAMTGIGVEDLYYGYSGDDIPSPADWTGTREEILEAWVSAGRLVLTIDYARNPAHVVDSYTRSHVQGFVPYVTDRDLDVLRINPSFEPD